MLLLFKWIKITNQEGVRSHVLMGVADIYVYMITILTIKTFDIIQHISV